MLDGSSAFGKAKCTGWERAAVQAAAPGGGVSTMMSATILSAGELVTRRDRSANLAIVDVRLPEAFAVAHMPGAINQCVFEVAFLDEFLKKSVRKEQPVCVYGADVNSHEARMAAEKLERAGFENVFEFRGGLHAWR